MDEARRPPSPPGDGSGSPFQGTAASDPSADSHAVWSVMNFFTTLLTTDESVQRAAATILAELISTRRRDNEGEGEISIVSEHLLASAHFATSLTTDSFRFVLLMSFFYDDSKSDCVLRSRCYKFTPRRWVLASLNR